MHIYNPNAFFTKTRTSFKKEIAGLWYISFEDALWDLLKNKKIPKGSKILIPSFYCLDVMNNIEAHGYKVVTYKINKDLSINEIDLLRKLQKHNPKVVISLHIQGKKSEIIENNDLRDKILEHTILIEDSVHRLESPQEIKIHSNNHYVITSLRKVTPFTGSWIIGTRTSIDWAPNRESIPKIYAKTALLLHNIYQTTLNFSYKVNSKIFSLVAEKILYLHNELIGNSKNAGNFYSDYQEIFFKLDFERIKEIKQRQYRIYYKNLKNLKHIHLVNVKNLDAKYLRGGILIVESDMSDDFLKYLRSENVITKYQLDDCDWSNERKLLLLPMGPFIKDSEIEELCKIIRSYKQ